MPRGRQRKPLELKFAEGDTHKMGARKFLQEIKSHPKTARDFPPCPDDLSPEAAKAFERISTELLGLNIDFGSCDYETMRGCATAVGRAIEASRDVQRLRSQVAEIECLKKIPPAQFRKITRLLGEIRRTEGLEYRFWEQFLRFSDRLGALSPLGRRGLVVRKTKLSLRDVLLAPDPPKVQ